MEMYYSRGKFFLKNVYGLRWQGNVGTSARQSITGAKRLAQTTRQPQSAANVLKWQCGFLHVVTFSLNLGFALAITLHRQRHRLI